MTGTSGEDGLRLLWITNMANPEPRSGGGIRSLRLIQAATAVWPVDVINVGTGLDVQAYLDVSGASSVQQFPVDLRSRTRTLRLVLRRQWPTGVALSHSSQTEGRAQIAAARGTVVVLEHGWMLGHLPAGGRVVGVLHNVDSELARQVPAKGLRRLERAWNGWAYERLQRRLARRADSVVTVVSERDARLLGGRVFVVPNGADVPSTPSRRPVHGGVLFVGSMGYRPNREAVRWWVEHVWPGQGLPPLTVVGQGAEEHLARWREHPAVDVVGEVDDVRPWLERARVVAVPLRSGSGSRLKVVEALAHRRPVVSTTKGAEGTGVVDGIHLLLADDALLFAAAVRKLLHDDHTADCVADAGFALAVAASWPRVGVKFVEALRQLEGN